MSDRTHPGEVMEFAPQWRSSQRQDEDTAKSVGLILDAPKPRDAIHVAVVCAQASEKVYPGEATGIVDGIATSNQPHVGIADPFLSKPVKQGEHFWIFLYPGTITSLNHSWTHPGIPEDDERRPSIKERTGMTSTRELRPDEQDSVSEAPSVTTADSKEEAEKWLRDYAASIPINFDELMDCANIKQRDEDYYFIQGGRFENECITDEFWEHYEAYTGKEAEVKENFFSCAC